MNDIVSPALSRQCSILMVRRLVYARIQPSIVVACVSLAAGSPMLKTRETNLCLVSNTKVSAFNRG